MKNQFILWFLISFVSCASPQKYSESDNKNLSFAKGFEIRYYSDYQQVIINNPWQKSSRVKYSYYLAYHPELLPDSLKSEIIIRTPLKRVIVFSTSHVGFLAAIGKSSAIIGVSGKDFISDSTVSFSIEKKECIDIGFAPNIDFESILALNPDIVFLYGLDPSVTGIIKRLDEAGIQSVMVSEFLEDHPLGKAEWIKFFAAFFDCKSVGDSIYENVTHNYTELKNSVMAQKERPSVLAGLPWKDTWYMAGGRSFTAKLIEDAGGEFLWKDNMNIDFVPLDLESVFQKAFKADIWINTGSAESKNEVLSVDPRFKYLPAFQNEFLFNNNLRLNSKGGNDFWESGAVRPDRILKDLIDIFHPPESGKNEFYYYRKLE